MNPPNISLAMPQQSHASRKPLINLLVSLGNLVLTGRHCSPWYGTQELSELCQEHDLELHNTTPTRKQLETELRELFELFDELYQDGINVIWNDNQIEWDSVFQIKFYRYDPQLKQVGTH